MRIITISLRNLLTISIVLNVLLTCVLIYNTLNGYPEARFGKIGSLKRDIDIGFISKGEKISVTLPKGLLVKDVSASGVDYFEPNRFKIIVTSDENDLVDYSIDQKYKLGHYYTYSINNNK